MWDNDEKFISWLNEEDIGTGENPLDDEILDLMYRAWQAGREELRREKRKYK